jgi:glutamate synthase (NADPH) small chain
MGKVTGFLEIDRVEQKYQPASDRIRHFREFMLPLAEPEVKQQAARCMDCGIPYCHSGTGCPVNNNIPDWNDLVYTGKWREAADDLHSTNNFPEITGRICPAPCEEACTLNLENTPVAIKCIEQTIADKAWEQGWVQPQPPVRKTGKRIAIIGSGPTGLAAAQQLARAGHDAHIFEREPFAGGLLRYGIPDFKMEKHHIERRVAQMQAEGVTFHCGETVDADRLEEFGQTYDAVLLAIGAETPRDPALPGQDLHGVHYAMPYLVQQNRRVNGETVTETPILATGKHVVVVGGGDTASDCVGTAFRQGALSVTQLDIRPCPPEVEDKAMSWPYWPTKMRTSSSQAEGAAREFSTVTLGLAGENGVLSHVRCARADAGRKPLANTEFNLPADLVFIALGFSGVLQTGLIADGNLGLDARGSLRAPIDTYATAHPKIFAAGDARRGQSLVVWAIREGREAAAAIDRFVST